MFYKRATSVRAQRDHRLHGVESISFVVAQGEIDPNDTLILLSHRGELFELNAAAAILWEALETECTLTDLVAVLADVFQLPAAEMAGDVQEHVSELLRMGAVVEVSQPHQN